jgi:hypothetical protein
MIPPRSRPVLIALACAALAACGGEEAAAPSETEILTRDPLLARALSDPLMVDPDLASRNEVNAVIAWREGHPLPPLEAREDAAAAAREAARLELLEGGQIPDLPMAQSGDGAPALAALDNAGEIVKAVGARSDCIEGMDARLAWSAQMPETSAIMPHGMIQQAAGVDMGTCVIRVLRYLTPVSPRDAIEYHFAKAERARFSTQFFEAPELQLRAERRDQVLSVHAREGPGGLTEVDVVHWRK